MKKRTISLSAGLALVAFLAAAPGALAAPDEIQVYTEEMDEPGTFGLETHVNFALKGARQPAYAGNTCAHHLLQVTPEFSYGVTRSWEAGMYVPVAVTPDGNLYQNGLRLRMKYIAPRDEGQRLFWGFNTELGYSARRASESYWGMELRPIVGYRGEDWLLAFNPIVTMDLSNNVSRAPQLEPAAKVTRRVRDGFNAGFEYYGEYGPLHEPTPAGERGHYLYGVVDVEAGKDFDVNFGIGRGFVGATDTWVAKAIIAFPFK